MARRTTLSEVFQRRLKEARKRAKLSQKELGIRAGMDPFSASPRMNRYELGIYEPDLDTIGRLAKVLGVPSAFLVADEDHLARIILLVSTATQATRGDIVNWLEEYLDDTD